MEKKLTILSLVFICSISISISVCSQSTKSDIVANERFENVRRMITDKIENGEVPSLSIAVAQNGKIIWMESFGYADKENRIKAEPNTLYSVASISKSLTATGIMKLYEMGKLDLDIDIEKYIAPFSLRYYVDESAKVTCRNLLTHTGGLPMHFNYYYDDDTWSIPPMEEVVKKYGIVVYPPSTRFSYANLGYGMLGYIISNITKRDFNEFMTEEIFKPLGMTETTVDISSKTKNRLAKRYDWNGNLLPFSFSDTPGAGNYSTTVIDLIHFGMFHLGNYRNNNNVLKDSTIQLMHQKQYPDALSSGQINNNRNTCGLGWFIDDKDYKYKVIYHAGGMDGIEGMMKLVPDKNIAVVALVNKSTTDAVLTNQIADSVLISLVPDLKDVEGKNGVVETRGVQKAKVIEQKDLVGKWKGNIETYNQKIPVEFIFQEDGDILICTKAQFNTGRLSNEDILNRFVQHKMLLDKWFFDNGHFMGTYPLNIPGDYLYRCADSKTMLDLQYESGKIKGIASALASSNRMYYGISYYLELEREK